MKRIRFSSACIMADLFAVVHAIRILSCVRANDEFSRLSPCPFASRFRAEGNEDVVNITIRHTNEHVHDDVAHGDDNQKNLLDLFRRDHHKELGAKQLHFKVKGQLSRGMSQMGETGEFSSAMSHRLLRKNRNIHKRGKNQKPNTEQLFEQKRKKGRKKKAGKTKNPNQLNRNKKHKNKNDMKKTRWNTLSPTESARMKNFSSSYCFSISTYESIDNDIAKLKESIEDDASRSHFLGGIVRLAAHDFMDFDLRDGTNLMGSDGCFDPMHPANAGLPETVWCKSCLLRMLYEMKYSFLSRADFWIASANAVIRQTSVKNALDLKGTFRWGRKDSSACPGSAGRLPEANGCKAVEDAFLTRMGLDWKDAVALLGAHSLGRGSGTFSGHEGTWVDNEGAAQVFSKQYYEEILLNAWRPRNMGLYNQDWTTGNNIQNQRMMLNTDICLVYSIDSNMPCCSKTDEFYPNGQSKCMSDDFASQQCPLYSKHDTKWAATEAVIEFMGGSKYNSNNVPFYAAFTEAWQKVTTNGWSGLSPLSECELI